MSNRELNVMAGATERSILANSNEFYEDEDHALRINTSVFGEILVGFSAGVFETPPTLTDNGDGTITLGSFQCLLFDNANKYGELQKFSIPGFTYSLVDDTTNYVVVNYNSGFPVVQIIQDVALMNESDVIPVYTIVRTGVILHTIPWDSLANGLSNKLNARFVKTRRFERESGLSLTCPLRVVTVSPGVVWYGGNAVSLEQCVSNVDSFRLYYHSAGVWTSNTATEVNITQYDDGNDLQPLTANRYAVNWIFRGVENQKHMYAVLGVGDYTLEQAQAAQVPALPDAITSHAILVGKIIIQQGAVSPFSVQSAFDTTFTGGAVQTASEVNEVNFGDVQTAITSLRSRARQNLLINSNFDFWQEGTSLSSGTGLRRSSDGGFSLSTGTTHAVSRQSFTVGQTSVPNGPKYYKRIVTSSVAGAGNFCLEAFEAECLESTSGKTISFSLWIKADATKNISVGFDQRFGTGGSSSVVGIGVKKQQITTSWARYTFTADMPSISGKTMGTIPGSVLIHLWFDAGSNYNSRTDSLGQQSGTFDIAQAKLEIGSFATDWEPYNLADELVKCQRYCEKSYDLDIAPGTITTAGMLSIRTILNEQYPVGLQRTFKVNKAYLPTITWYSNNSGAINTIYCDSPAGDRAVSETGHSNTYSTGYPALTTANSDAGADYYAHFISRAYL